MKIGSLFDGSGGFPLAASLCGITPTFASEVEPYPIAVTTSRFPHMRHLGDISKINGAEVEAVDVITFGSPCQDLSVAGKRAGLKHSANGDDETTRSGLFMEAVRIIKEMRRATNGEYPKFAVWENVPGAFSSNKGEDFRIVLEELIKICEPEAPEIPSPGKAGWPYADCIMGNGWSLAWRLFDTQYWPGTPQRRKRIYLVLDLTGGRAEEVLFERPGLRGHFEESGAPWEEAPGHAGNRSEADDPERGSVGRSASERDVAACLYAAYGTKWNGNSGAYSGENFVLEQTFILDNIGGQAEYGTESPVNGTLRAGALGAVAYCYDARGNGDGETVNTITGDHNNRITDYSSVVCEPIPIHDQATRFNGKRGDKADGKGNGLGVGAEGDPMNTLTSGDRHAVAYATDVGFFSTCENVSPTMLARMYKDPHLVCYEEDPQYIVRRLTTTECAMIQGFPDTWGYP